MSYPLLDVFWTMLWFFLWIMWLFLVGWILLDILRSHDIGGWAKAGWILLVILVPLIGVVIYVAVHERSIGDLDTGVSRSRRHSSGAAGASGATELSTLADLRARGVITDAEFQRGKDQIQH
jgi:hypothetical protein